MTPEQEQKVKAELKQRHKESSEFLDTCIAKEQREVAKLLTAERYMEEHKSTPPMDMGVYREMRNLLKKAHKGSPVLGVKVVMQKDGNRMLEPVIAYEGCHADCKYFFLLLHNDGTIYSIFGNRKEIASMMPDDDIDDFSHVDEDKDVMFGLPLPKGSPRVWVMD